MFFNFFQLVLNIRSYGIFQMKFMELLVHELSAAGNNVLESKKSGAKFMCLKGKFLPYAPLKIRFYYTDI